MQTKKQRSADTADTADSDDAEEEFQVEHIVDTREEAKATQFRVMWEGYPDATATWEPEEHVQDTAALDRYLKLCKYRKLLLAEHKQRKPCSTRARNSSAAEPEGEPELSSVEEAIAKSSYCVAKAGGAGLGVFALETIPAGSFLWMYEGKRMRTGDRNASLAARYIARQGGDIRYCFRCEGGVTIDASQGGNDSRFVNHFEGGCVGV